MPALPSRRASVRATALSLALAALVAPLACGDYLADLPDEGGELIRGIQLDVHRLEIYDGGTARLRATLLDAGGQPVDVAADTVVWWSSDSTVVTVGDAGLVTGRHPGEARVTAEVTTSLGSAAVSVGVVVHQVATDLEHAGPGEADGVVAEPADSPAVRVVDRHGDGAPGVAVRFTAAGGAGSLSDTVAVSDSTGRAAVAWTLGTAAGEQRVEARADDLPGVSALTFLVRAAAGPAVTLAVTPDTVRLAVLGDTLRLAAAGADAYGNPIPDSVVGWSAADPAIATVDGTGLVTATGPGATVVVARAGERADTSRVVVSPAAVVAAAAGDEQTAAVGETLPQPLTVRVVDAEGLPVTGLPVAWSVSAGSVDPDTSLTDGDGLASTRWTLETVPGLDTLTATVAGLPPAVMTARAVVGPVARIVLDPAADTLDFLGDSVRIAATAVDAYGNPVPDVTVAWSSADPAIATVSDAGMVTAVAIGATFVRAAAGDVTDSSAITVRQVAASVTVTPSEVSVVPGGTAQLTAVAHDAGGSPLPDAAFDWSSGAPAIATVDTAGLVTAVAEGETSVTAVHQGLSDSARVVVSTAPDLGDPYEPNDSIEYTDIEAAAAADARLDAYDGAPGLPFRTTTDPELGSAAVAADGDVDRYLFRVQESPALVSVSLTESAGVAPLLVRIRDHETGELWLRTVEVAAGTDGSGWIRLPHGRYFVAEVASAAADQTQAAPYVLELSELDYDLGQDPDWLNGDLVSSLEPNDLSVMEGATRPAAFPYDVIGSAAGSWDVDLMAVPAGEAGSLELDLDHRGTSGAITAQLYRRDPTTSQLEPVAGESLQADNGLSVSGYLQPADGEPHFLGVSGSGDYDLCLRGRWDDCRALAVEAAGGDGQVGGIDQPLPDSLVVQVWGSDAYEGFTDPVENALVKFSATGGTLSATEVMTDANGIARVAYTLPSTPGGYQVRAWVTGANVVWSSEDTIRFEAVAAPSLDGEDFVQVSAGGYHTCALTAEGVAFCWGDNWSNQLGLGLDMDEVPVPLPVATDLRFTDISAGMYHTCAVATDGTGYCWGDGWLLGTGEHTDHATPVAVDFAGTWQQIEAGHWHTCGVATGGQAYCWGDGYNGAIGDGSTVDRLIPTAVASSVEFQSITAGIYSSCAVATGGTAYCWGDGGTVGRAGAPYANPVPQPVDGGHSFSTIHSGDWYICAIGGGNVYCWGDNSLGQFGTGSATYGGVDSPLLGPSGYAQVDGAEEHTCGVTTTGEGACWGYNSYGQLGVSYDTRWASYSPLTLTDPSAWRVLTAGEQHSCGITAAGVLYCWGSNTTGQLGTGATDYDEHLPGPVGLP
ncbi:MAG: Ig-like domain-containing protein [Longimicrobiales bacterium]